MKKVLILFGGNSYEHEISCKSVNFLIDNIDKNIDYSLVGIDFDNSWYEVKKTLIDKNWKNYVIKKIDNIIEFSKSFDIVFPMIHGNTFEDGKLQSLFEMHNINYVGCDSYSSLICYDKLLTKLFLEKYNIPQVPYLIYKKGIDLNNIKDNNTIGVIKSNRSRSGHITKDNQTFTFTYVVFVFFAIQLRTSTQALTIFFQVYQLILCPTLQRNVNLTPIRKGMRLCAHVRYYRGNANHL